MLSEISAAWILKITTVEAEIAQTEGARIGLVFNDVAEKLNWLGYPYVAKLAISRGIGRFCIFHILLFDS